MLYKILPGRIFLRRTGLHFAGKCPIYPERRRSFDCRGGCGHGIKDAMITDRISSDIGRFTARIVIDDRSRLPGRFFGRFATSAT
ncbi:hypothetical protein Nwi_2784 [Nitrobacter winogradskyi Nb-255]|uniref:Uncharacterized protein n=1 Tax=Nitrobacter winogradskyi (strain ATCC 25391 / DSM 10237 / CIP 104748 / NCIMB 11846 / Nb-255) TaxID=323098 RepID=Q3SNV4_NITWN|nr:hypothetical protein Nwi_2784 [Nitrobacter winogradskyi Nb-255]